MFEVVNRVFEVVNHSIFVSESVTVFTFEQLRLGLNSLLHAFSAELLTVLSCDNFSNQPKFFCPS